MILSPATTSPAPRWKRRSWPTPHVAECAVAGQPDEERGQIVAAFVVLRSRRHPATRRWRRSLQDHVKATIAPYKYPRAVTFVDRLPKTATGGGSDRFRIREGER